MTPAKVIYFVAGLWLIVAAVVIGYPLCSGQIRVGLNPVRRDTARGAFWTAYAISTAVFLVVSAAAGIFIRAIIRR